MTGTCEKHGINLHTPRRYPLQALADHFPGTPLRALCEQLKVSGTTYEQYLCHGVIAKTADKLAARADLPVYSVWPEMIDHAIADTSRECAADDCDTKFIGHPNRRYCSRQCRRRTQARRHRQRHPDEYRDKMRRWKAANADEYREYNRRYQRRYMREWRARRREQGNAA